MKTQIDSILEKSGSYVNTKNMGVNITEYIVTAEEMKRYDGNTIHKIGVPSLVLMERAALSVADIICDKYGFHNRVLVVAGCGNNGGDGVAIGRILKERGMQVEIAIIGKKESMSEETAVQVEIAKAYNIPVTYRMMDSDYDLIVDALFGIGLKRNLEGRYLAAVQSINERLSKVISVDIPSGIDSNTGKVFGEAVKADITVTFGFRKLGHVLYPGTQYTGELYVKDIGITKHSFMEMEPDIFTYNMEDKKLPARNPAGNKGTFGKVFLIAGSKNMCGACQFAAASAFRMGAGMVRILTAYENLDILKKKIPEAIFDTYTDATTQEEVYQKIEEGINWSTVLAVGPGMGTEGFSKSMLEKVIAYNTKPLVLDADALTILAMNEGLMRRLERGVRRHSYDIIVTPHMGEFARLLHTKVSNVQDDFFHFIREFSEKYDVTLACKDARSVAVRRGKAIYLNTSGNDGMATAGSGDVLTGIITGLLAQGMNGFDAACLGEFIHGLAGDVAKEHANAYYIMAQDIIHALQFLLKDETER